MLYVCVCALNTLLQRYAYSDYRLYKIITLYTNAPVLTYNTVHENYRAVQCLGCIRLGITVTVLLFFKKRVHRETGRDDPIVRAIAGNRYKVFFSVHNKNRAIPPSFAPPDTRPQIRTS